MKEKGIVTATWRKTNKFTIFLMSLYKLFRTNINFNCFSKLKSLTITRTSALTKSGTLTLN